MVCYTCNEWSDVSLFNDMFRFDRQEIRKVMNLKLIVLLLFFEHRYLSTYSLYRTENVYKASTGSSRGKHVSKF